MAHVHRVSSATRGLLANFGLDRYHIEYQLFKANHLLHALVALDLLGASEQRQTEWTQAFVKQLEPPQESEGEIQGDQWRSLMGKMKRFPDLRQFFSTEMRKRGRDATLQSFLPGLLDGGTSCAAFHPLIHMGYGLMADSDQDVADGMAYLIWTHSAPHAQPAPDDDPIAVQINSADAPVPEWAKAAPIKGSPTDDGLLSHPIAAAVWKLRSDVRLQRLLCMLQERGGGGFNQRMALIPDIVVSTITTRLDESGLFDSVMDDKQLGDAFHTVLEGVTIVYASTEKPDDFFVLHGLTSAFALKYVLPHLPTFEDRKRAVRIFCRDVLMVYILRHMPALVPWSAAGADLPSWSEIKAHTVQQSDEHLIKVMYSCMMLDEEYGGSVLGSELYRATAAFKSGMKPWPRHEA